MAQALYRKYRSKSLQEIVGQEHITDTLDRALKNKATSHAYLFTGLRGTGKTSVARILAHDINELPYSDESIHLDIIEIDAASNRRIDDVRDLRDKVHIAPTSARYKVYIIDEVHMLTGESFNALLKTLEEPPAHVVFILATTEVHKLPATIISRTQRFHFRAVAKDKVIAHLKHIAELEKIKIDQGSLELIAEYGEGSFRDSISLLDQLAAMSGNSIDCNFVEQSLGLASAETVNQLVNLLSQADRSVLHAELQKLEDQGVSASVLAMQLIRALKSAALHEPRFYSLIDALLDLPKSAQPQLKLLVTLLGFLQTDTPQVAQPTAPKVVAQMAAPAARTLQKEPIQIKRDVTPTKTRAALAPKKSEPVMTTTTNNDGKELTSNEWAEILSDIQQSNPPFFSMIKNAEPRFEGDTLTLAFSFKLHQIKLDDSRYRTKLVECITKLGYRCPVLQVIHDSNALAPIMEASTSRKTEVPETTASVLAMMGGGDVVNA